MSTAELADTDRSLVSAGITAVLVAIATAIAYGTTLAWDSSYNVAPDGSVSGPYSELQVGVLAVLMILIVGYAGWRGRPLIGAGVATFVLVSWWTVWASSSDDSGMWGVGAIMMLVGCSVGLSIVGALGYIARECIPRKQSARGAKHAVSSRSTRPGANGHGKVAP